MSSVVTLLSPFIKLKRSGELWWTGSCPFHPDRKPSFAIKETSGFWVCHSCHQRGSLHRLLRYLGRSPAEIEKILSPLKNQIESEQRRDAIRHQARFRKDPFRGDFILAEGLLGAYDYAPLELLDKGFNPGLLRSLDIGFDHYLRRITFPLRDLYGNLIGISGRTVTGEQPKYLIYKGGYWGRDAWIEGHFGPNFDQDYPHFKCNISHILWYGQEALPSAYLAPAMEPLVVVEGFKACLWVIQAGFPLTVALCGSSPSTYQADLLRRLSNPIVLFLDANEAGQKGTRKLVEMLSLTNEVRVVTYPKVNGENAQPDDFSADTVRELIQQARRRYARQQTIR